MWPNLQFPTDLVTFAVEALDEKLYDAVYVTIENLAFCLTFYLTCVHFRGELQHSGHVGEQKIKCRLYVIFYVFKGINKWSIGLRWVKTDKEDWVEVNGNSDMEMVIWSLWYISTLPICLKNSWLEHILQIVQ